MVYAGTWIRQEKHSCGRIYRGSHRLDRGSFIALTKQKHSGTYNWQSNSRRQYSDCPRDATTVDFIES